MKPSKKSLFYSTLFTVFLLTYMVTLSVTDGYVKELDASGIMLHYPPGFTRIAGFISFWICRSLIGSERGRRIQLIITATLFPVSSVILMTSGGTSVTMACLFIMSFSVGHLGGLIYYCMSIAFETDSCKGKIIGSTCALSILIQFFLTGFSNNTVQLVIATILILLIFSMLIRTPADFVLEDPLPYADYSEQYGGRVRLQLAGIIVVMFICMLLACRTDIAFVSMSFDGSVNIYSYPRLAMIPGYLLMGFIADLKKPAFFSTAFMCAMLLSGVLVLMPFHGGGYLLFLSIYYFFISVYIFFYTYSFVSVAPRTKKPELWASIGRPLSDLFVTLISFLMLRLGDERLNASPIQYALYYFILLIVLYIVTNMIRIDPNLSEEQSPAPAKPQSVDDWLTTCSLTPRETDVAHLLINTDLPIKAIASELNISERSVYRYASSIYEKTGTENRTGLIKASMN